MKNVALAGSSGFVGNLVLQKLLTDPEVEKIILIGRSKLHLPIIHESKVIQIVTNFEELQHADLKLFGVNTIDSALCSLGTTIKKAGSKEAFKKVDCDYVVKFAEWSKDHGAISFSVISALGADKMSGVFYNRVKGEMEEELQQLHFNQLTILRPSLLLGDRPEFRMGEKLFIKLSPLMNKVLLGPLKKYRGIEIEKVATQLVNSIKRTNDGIEIVENNQMLNL